MMDRSKPSRVETREEIPEIDAPLILLSLERFLQNNPGIFGNRLDEVRKLVEDARYEFMHPPLHFSPTTISKFRELDEGLRISKKD